MAYHRFDAVIVGAGGAGLTAAVQLAGRTPAQPLADGGRVRDRQTVPS